MSSSPTNQLASTENLLDNPLAKTPNSVEWIQTLDLAYDSPAPPAPVCFSCGKLSPSFKCQKCGIASYCNRDCQISDWKKGRHKHACASYSRLSLLVTKDSMENTQKSILNE